MTHTITQTFRSAIFLAATLSLLLTATVRADDAVGSRGSPPSDGGGTLQAGTCNLQLTTAADPAWDFVVSDAALWTSAINCVPLCSNCRTCSGTTFCFPPTRILNETAYWQNFVDYIFVPCPTVAPEWDRRTRYFKRVNPAKSAIAAGLSTLAGAGPRVTTAFTLEMVAHSD